MPNSAVKPLSADGSVGPPHARVGHRQAFIRKTPASLEVGVFLWCMGRPAFSLWGRFADRPLAGSGRSSALAAVPRRAGRSHPHARVGHRQAFIQKNPEFSKSSGFFYVYVSTTEHQNPSAALPAKSRSL